MRALKHRDDVRQQVGAGDARRDDRKRAGRGVAKSGNPSGRLEKKRLGAQHVIGKEVAGRSQRPTPRVALDQLHPDLSLDIRDVLRDGRLTDPELSRGYGKRAVSRDRRERAQARVHVHNRGL